MAALLDPSSAPHQLRRITFGGESVSQSLVERWADRVELVTAYGLSENTQMNWRHELKHGVSHRLIGRPTDSTTHYVLTPGTLQLTPFDVPGELCLGGHQLARGYLRNPGKTKQVFVDNPFGPGRLYRTGDSVVRHRDGNIELLGRIDQQIKISGQRVEPEESNNLIRQNTEVAESAVVAADVFNRTALVAVVATSADANWSPLLVQLRKNVGAQLPSYASPSYWIKLDEIPHNVNGKMDVSKLKKMVESLDERELLSATRSRRDSILTSAEEDEIVQAVAGRLGIAPLNIDLHVSFLDLGGSSLDAIHVCSELKDKGVVVDVASILQAESLKQVADECKQIDGLAKDPEPFSLAPPKFRRKDSMLDAYPTTPLQEALLAETLMGNDHYVYRRAFRIQNSTPPELKAAFESVISQSALLRTGFVFHKGSFMQVVNVSIELPWQELDTDAELYLKAPVRSFGSIDAPLFRATVINGNVLVVDIHHALFDFWSSRFLFDDINSLLLGKSQIPRASFSNYVQFQREQHNESTQTFWQDYLSDASKTPIDLQGLGSSAQNYSQVPFVVQTRAEVDFNSMKLNQGMTVGSLMHAAWALALSLFTNQDDVQFAAAFSGRDADVHGILSLDGPTLCTVPMRIKLDQAMTLQDLVHEVQANHLWKIPAFAHYGMRNALKAGGVEADSFNTMINILVKHAESSETQQPLEAIALDRPNYTDYITLEVDESNPGLIRLLVPFAANVEAAQGLIDSFARILELAIEAPTTTVQNVVQHVDTKLITLDEDIRNGSDRLPILAQSGLEAVAISNPDKIAIHDAKRKLSYRRFNGLVNSFAHWLRTKGVQPGDIIPLYMEKSSWTLIAIFGIMKAGAAFTPLDPANPDERNDFIVKDVEAKCLITDRTHATHSQTFGVETILPEDLGLSEDTSNPPVIPELKPENIGWIIYTSGSTGTPKGVLVPHSAVVASTEGMIEATNVDSTWRSLWVLNYVFDASYYDVFTIFSVGGTLCVLPQDDLISDLTGSINSFDATQVMLTPTMTKLISGGPKSVPRIKVLNVCGEKIDTNILEWAKSVDVYNGYGPTEATILMTVSKVLPGSSLNSIGYPLKHVAASVHETNSAELKPHGEVGELCVSGAQLALSYHNRTEQTAAAFILDVHGNRLYRTGDLARWHEDGYIE